METTQSMRSELVSLKPKIIKATAIFIRRLYLQCSLTLSLQDKLELYNFDPLEVIVLLSELTDQNLSLIHNITRMDKKMEHTFEVTIKKM